jgi:GT2 family glycosyltransferase
MNVRISVVVPTYRRPEMLERCLAALAAQSFPGRAYEIVVADDGVETRVRETAARWNRATGAAPAVRYVPVTETQGPAGARNRGWEAAQGEIIAFTDDDTVPEREWLAEGGLAMAAAPDILAASGCVVVPLPPGAPTDHEKDVSRLSEAEFVTANCFVRRAALQAVGGFDERFTSAWREDSDLQFMLMQLGGRLVCAPRAIVSHPVRPAGGWDNLRAHRKIAFDALLFKKHPRLYRERIRHAAPWNYYVMVAGMAAFFAGGLLALPALAWAGVLVWLVPTVRFARRRLEGTSRDPHHVAEVILTSIAIPPVAVFWRLAGALRFRVFFL